MGSRILKSSCAISYTLSTHITKTDTCCERGEPYYPVYVIIVTKNNSDGSQEVWEVLREYSDFEDIHSKITENYEYLPEFRIPTKTIFDKITDGFLEKRRLDVNGYLHNLLNPSLLNCNKGLFAFIAKFLQHKLWDREQHPLDSRGLLSHNDRPLSIDRSLSVNTTVNPISNRSCTSNYTLTTQITRTDTCCERSNCSAVYAISVTKRNSNGSEEVWEALRSYKDFEYLHTKISKEHGNVPVFPLPSAFKGIRGTTKKDFLEKWRSGVNAYLHNLLNPSLLNIHQKLMTHIFNFLQHSLLDQSKYPLDKEVIQDIVVPDDRLPSVDPIIKLVRNCSCTRNYTITAQVTKTVTSLEHDKSCAAYVISVTKHNSNGSEEVWRALRSYSNFEYLHSKIVEQYGISPDIVLPGATTLNKMNMDFLEKWRLDVNAYLQALLEPSRISYHEGLQDLVFNFLEHELLDTKKYPLDREPMKDLAFTCDTFPSAPDIVALVHKGSYSTNYTLTARIINTDTYCGHCNSHDVFVIAVTKRNSNGSEEVWDVLREYGDFKCLHSHILKQFGSIPSLAFPGGAFSKVNKTFLEKQQSDFDAYLQTLLSPSLVSSHGGLQDLAFNFLEHRVWNQEKYPLDRKITILETFKRTISMHNAAPLAVAIFWKDVLDNHLEDIIGCNIASFVNDTTEAVEGVQECVRYLAKVCKDCGIAAITAGSASVVSGGLVVGGLILAPITGGVSIALTMSGLGLGAAAGVTSAGTAVAKYGLKKTQMTKIKDKTEKVINNMGTLQDLLVTCMDAFFKADEYINTDKGRQLADLVAEADQQQSDTSSNNTGKTSVHKIPILERCSGQPHGGSHQLQHRQPKSFVNTHKYGSSDINAALRISKTAACVGAMGVTKSGGQAIKYATYDASQVIKRTARAIRFIKSVSRTQVAVRSTYALETSAEGLSIGSRTVIRAGSTGAKAFTGVLAGLNIGLGILDIVFGSRDIRNPTEALKGLHEFASRLEVSSKELKDIYENLNGTQ